MTNPRPDLFEPNHRIGFKGCEAEFDIPRLLIACIDNQRQWLEYGVIEYLLMEHYEDVYYELIRRGGHRSLGVSEGTASKFLGGCVGRLVGSDGVRTQQTQTTGWWARHLNRATSAAYRPTDNTILTWHDYATNLELDPDEWEFTRPRP